MEETKTKNQSAGSTYALVLRCLRGHVGPRPEADHGTKLVSAAADAALSSSGLHREPAARGGLPPLPVLGVPSTIRLLLALLLALLLVAGDSAIGAVLLPRALTGLGMFGDVAVGTAATGSEGEDLGLAQTVAVSAPRVWLHAHFSGVVLLVGERGEKIGLDGGGKREVQEGLWVEVVEMCVFGARA